MMTLKRTIAELFEGVYILSESEKRFIQSFGTPEKPVSLAEFIIFWGSLTDGERFEIMLDYNPNDQPVPLPDHVFMKPYSPKGE
jgi:hypothetical protein